MVYFIDGTRSRCQKTIVCVRSIQQRRRYLQFKTLVGIEPERLQAISKHATEEEERNTSFRLLHKSADPYKRPGPQPKSSEASRPLFPGSRSMNVWKDANVRDRMIGMEFHLRITSMRTSDMC
eukprot:746332-Hanusia_phi.AAC.17